MNLYSQAARTKHPVWSIHKCKFELTSEKRASHAHNVRQGQAFLVVLWRVPSLVQYTITPYTSPPCRELMAGWLAGWLIIRISSAHSLSFMPEKRPYQGLPSSLVTLLHKEVGSLTSSSQSVGHRLTTVRLGGRWATAQATASQSGPSCSAAYRKHRILSGDRKIPGLIYTYRSGGHRVQRSFPTV